MPERRTSSVGRYVIMAITALTGVVLILISDHLAGFWKTATEHLGTAILIASFLGFTVDWWLKRQIAEDVFEAAMGYELPDDLKTEIRHVYNNRVLCEDHVQAVSITPIDATWVTVTIGTERRLKNNGGSNENISLTYGVDEWGIDGHPSRITEFGYVSDGRRTLLDPRTVSRDERPEGPLYIGPEVTLKPGEDVTVFAKFSETKPINGEHVHWFSYATRNPRVTVNAPGFGWLVGFSHRGDPVRGKYSDTVTLPGLLLTHQGIRIRWWKQP